MNRDNHYFVIEDTDQDDCVVTSAPTLKEARQERAALMLDSLGEKFAITSRKRGVIVDFDAP